MAVRQLMTSRFVPRVVPRQVAWCQVVPAANTSQYAPRFPKRPDPEDNIFNEAKFAERAPVLTDAEKMKEKDRTIGPARYLALAATTIAVFVLVYKRAYTSDFVPSYSGGASSKEDKR